MVAYRLGKQLIALCVLYSLCSVIVLSPRMRAYLLYIRFRLIKREVMQSSLPCRDCTVLQVVNTLVKKSKMGDWFLFYMLGQNVDSMIFKVSRR